MTSGRTPLAQRQRKLDPSRGADKIRSETDQAKATLADIPEILSISKWGWTVSRIKDQSIISITSGDMEVQIEIGKEIGNGYAAQINPDAISDLCQALAKASSECRAEAFTHRVLARCENT